MSGFTSPSERCLNVERCTDYLEDDCKNNEDFHKEQESVEPEVVAGSNTVRHPRTVMIVDTHTPLANLAMSRSLRFDQLRLSRFTIQSKHILEGCVFLSMSKSICSASTIM